MTAVVRYVKEWKGAAMKLTSKNMLEKSRIEGLFKDGVGSISIASFCGTLFEYRGWHFCISGSLPVSVVMEVFEQHHAQDL